MHGLEQAFTGIAIGTMPSPKHINSDSLNAPMTLAQREREYSPSSCIGGDYRPFLEAYAQRSREASVQAGQAGARWLELRYGTGPSQRIDLCLPHLPRDAAGAGVLVFIHGGYWQELSARDSLFPAAHAIRRGWAYAAIDYTLAPHARIGEMVVECRTALQTLAAQASAWGLDPARIVVAGSSAGAHLAAMACLPHAGHAPTDSSSFKPHAAVLLSGIYELEPLIGTSINEALGLDVAQAHALSPARHALQGFARTLVAWGDVETAAFKQQSRHFAGKLRQAGTECTEIEVAGRNHFDVVLDLADPASAFGRLTLDV